MSVAVVKVIIETCLLTCEENALACSILKKARAQFVKISTGLPKGRATSKDIALMRGGGRTRHGHQGERGDVHLRGREAHDRLVSVPCGGEPEHQDRDGGEIKPV
jgi:hypothetical protein